MYLLDSLYIRVQSRMRMAGEKAKEFLHPSEVYRM